MTLFIEAVHQTWVDTQVRYAHFTKCTKVLRPAVHLIPRFCGHNTIVLQTSKYSTMKTKETDVLRR